MGVRLQLTALALCAAMQAGGAWAQAPASPSDVGSRAALPRDPEQLRRDPMKALDISEDGLIDVAEAKSAAAARYNVLNPTFDEQVDRRAAAASLAGDEFDRADADKNGMVNKAEYVGLIDSRHGEADTDKDGKLSRSELEGKGSEALLRLLR